MQNILEALQRLEQKVDNLTLEIKTMKNYNSGLAEPNQTIEEWLQSSHVQSTHINQLFTQQDGTINAFKNFILSNNEKDKMPISFNNKKLNLFCEEKNGVKTWIHCNDENLGQIICEVWRKFLEFYLSLPEDNSIHEDVIFLQKQKILQMRSELYDVQKTKKEILKWLQNIA